MATILLNKKDVKELLDIGEVIKAVEDAFISLEHGKAYMPPKAYLQVEQGDFRAMPAAIPGAAGIKWVNVHPGNQVKGLPTIMAALIYNDPATGYPLAIMEAGEITAFRTAAASAIASKYMARLDSNILGIIGAGYQAYMHIVALALLFKFTEIRVFDVSVTAGRKLANSLSDYPIKLSSSEDAAAADIVCTLTPSGTPIVERAWIKPGTHINAVGADARGKQELDPLILKDAFVVVDDIRQASAAGEINVPVAEKLYSVDDIYAVLGELVAGKKAGRKNNESITVFDSTGIAIEDIAVAKLIYEKAKSRGNYLSIDMV
jgi:alanine dehydrogenase